jgi:hypothetical protein
LGLKIVPNFMSDFSGWAAGDIHRVVAQIQITPPKA